MAPYREKATRHWHPDYAERPTTPPPKSHAAARSAALVGVALLIVPINFVVFCATFSKIPALFYALAIAQLAAGIGSLVYGIASARDRRTAPFDGAMSVFGGVCGMIVGLGGPLGIWLANNVGNINTMGSSWGRPLRLRGRILHPRLRAGSDWTKGARPDTTGLDAPTRTALEALWLHDAQKEHASVPAFSRISWVLAAVGAPAELVEGAHRAAMEEIDHARRCFALAAGYGARAHGVEAMPELLVGGLDVRGDPLATMATESLTDGCLLEDFNADVAAACAVACKDAAVRDVLERIAREERSHADFSWDVLAWLVARGEDRVTRAIEKGRVNLVRVARPTAVSSQKAAMVAEADAAKMRAHGRIADAEWARLWVTRVVETGRRADALLQKHAGRRAA